MGLLTVPKKYNPPGKHTPQESLLRLFVDKNEKKAVLGLLNSMQPDGKPDMTKYGVPSFGLGDKGNSVGSAGGSNYSGDGAGGQVNMDGVGMGGSNVLRNIAGKWNVVSRDVAAQIDAGGGIGPIRQKPTVPAYRPAAAPITPPVVTPPVVKPEVYLDPQIAGRLQAALASKPAAPAPAAATTYPNSMPGNSNPSLNYGAGTTNAVSPLGAGNTFGAMASAGNTPGTVAAGGAGNQTSPTPTGGRSGFGGNATAPSMSPSGGRTGFGGNAQSFQSNLAYSANGPSSRAQMPNYGSGPAQDVDTPSPFGGGRTGFSGNATLGEVKYNPNGMQGSTAGNAFGGYPNAQNGAYQGSLPGTSNAAPQAITDPYGGMGKFGMNSGQTSPYNQPGAAVTDPYGGMGKFGMNSGQTSPYNQPSPSVAMDPQIAGRLQDTRRVTAGLGNINEMLNGLQSGWDQPNIADPRLSYPSEEGQVYGPASLASYPGAMPKIQDRVATRPSMSPGQTLNNQTINDAVHPNSMLNASRMPQGNPVSPASFGPETPQGPADWQQGTGYTDPVKSNAPTRTQDIQIDPTSSYSPEVQTAASRIMDVLSGGSAYRDAVSNGSESDRRTDRAPSGGGGFSPGSFGPGGGDRRGGPGSGYDVQGGPGYQPQGQGQGQVTAADKALIDALPAEERDRLMKLKNRSPLQFMRELAKLRAKAPTTTPPPVTPLPPQQQWYYPQYTQSWANLPTGLGGLYGRT